MIKYIKTHWKDIVSTLALALAFTSFLGLVRPYKAFGGEDLLPIMTLVYWLFSFIDEKESEEK